MKSFKLFNLAAVIAVISILSLSSCSNNDNAVNSSDDSMPEYLVSDYDINSVDMTEATMDSEINLNTILPPGVERPENMDRNSKFDRVPPNPFGFILRKLELTDAQKDSIRKYFKGQKECEFYWLRKLRQSQMEIIKDSREKQKAIMDDLKDSVITRQEAKQALKELNIETRKALINNPVNADVREGLKDCFEELIAKIKALLTEEQLAKFERWLENLPKRPVR